MKIQSESLRRSSVRTPRARPQGASDFSVSLNQEAFPHTGGLAGAPQGASVNTVSPLVEAGSVTALSGIEEREARGRAVKRGEAMLDELDALKQALLQGQTPDKNTLDRLSQLCHEARENFSDDQLGDMIDAIETRAAVELAKRNF